MSLNRFDNLLGIRTVVAMINNRKRNFVGFLQLPKQGTVKETIRLFNEKIDRYNKENNTKHYVYGISRNDIPNNRKKVANLEYLTINEVRITL